VIDAITLDGRKFRGFASQGLAANQDGIALAIGRCDPIVVAMRLRRNRAAKPAATKSHRLLSVPFLFSRRNVINCWSLSNTRKNARHCSHFPSFRCSTNLAALTLRNFEQSLRLGELRRTANCSSVNP